jgi:hypothetical protein
VPSVLAPHTRRREGARTGPPLSSGPTGTSPATLARRPGSPSAEIDDGVIKEARRRQRRRRALGLSVIFMAALIAAGLLRGTGAVYRPHPPRGAGTGAAAPSSSSATAMLAREPDLGVACGVPNSIRCDRIGLAVWLRRPAASVTATVAGAPIELDDPTWSGPALHGRRTMFAGFLQPAGMLKGPLKVRADRGRYWWAGAHPTYVRVRIIASYGQERRVSVTTTVLLRAGWG